MSTHRTARRRSRQNVVGAVTAAALIIAAVIAGWNSLADDAPETAMPPVVTSPAPTAVTDGSFADALAEARELAVIDTSVQIPEYRRDAFGERWADVDDNGCDQRQDVLRRDLVELQVDGCTVLHGVLTADPYTRERIEFWHDRVAPAGDPGSVGIQIDHVMSLAAAHRGGAWRWTDERRELFANGLDQLRAVDGPTNQSKSDKGPGRWLPPAAGARCHYARDYVDIAARWNLAVDVDDKAVLVDQLEQCAVGG